METIRVDFEVFQALTARRASSETSLNDVIRQLLKLGPVSSEWRAKEAKALRRSWISKGVVFPEGTEFQASYKGRRYSARVESGVLSYRGAEIPNLSNLAHLVTQNNVNGWRFWKCRLPGSNTWQSAESERIRQQP